VIWPPRWLRSLQTMHKAIPNKAHSAAFVPLTKAQNARRKALYDQGLTDRAIAERLGLDPTSIYQWRKRNGLPAVTAPNRPWTVIDTERLLRSYRDVSAKECARLLGRSLRSIEGKLRAVEAAKKRARNWTDGKRAYDIAWTLGQVRTLRATYGREATVNIASRLGRTVGAIQKKASLLRLRIAVPSTEWQYRDIVLLLDLAVPIAQLPLSVPRTRKAVSSMKGRLKEKFRDGTLEAYLSSLAGAPPRKRRAECPRGLAVNWSAMNRLAKDKRAGEYLAREAERERQKAAFKKWQASAPNSKRR